MKELCHMPRPCVGCPFLRDGDGVKPVRLYADRIVEIVGAIAPEDSRGSNFPCHKTVDHDNRNRQTEKECTGGLIFAYKLGQTSQLTRICERLGLIDPMLADEGEWPEVFDSLDEMLATAIDAKPKRKRAR